MYLAKVTQLCSPAFWKIYNTVKNQTSVCADNVLSQVRSVLQSVSTKPRIALGHQWPTSTRSLLKRIHSQAGKFWENITFQCSIDMQQFDLPLVNKVRFTFVDPIYVWLDHANSVVNNGHELHWNPRHFKHDKTDQDTYGAGVQFGLLLRAAKSSIPSGGRVTLMNLSWDSGNTGYSSRGATPICIQVMNCNSKPTNSVGLVAYLPHLNVSDACQNTEEYKKATHYLLQVTTHM